MPGNRMFSVHHPHKSVEAFLSDFPLPSLKKTACRLETSSPLSITSAMGSLVSHETRKSPQTAINPMNIFFIKRYFIIDVNIDVFS